MSGFKRRARVLFLAGRHPVLAAQALQAARELAGEWLECRAASMTDVSVPAGLPQPESWSSDLLKEVDLLVAVDDDVPQLTLPAGVQRRNYSFVVDGLDALQQSDVSAALRQSDEKARQRVLGMIGGMRLMQKAAAEDA